MLVDDVLSLACRLYQLGASHFTAAYMHACKAAGRNKWSMVL